ncbi:MAG TPA: hypothetical protein VHE78_03165 [Gemmatimonadaceae bacterium]|nr:hypothetical protein [Gemmatimonadaceae bacterium]
MQNDQHRQIDSIIRVSQFMADHQLDGPPYTAVRKRIDAAAIALPALAEAQYRAHSRVVEVGGEILLLRQALREDHMIKIARTGKMVMKHDPGARKTFKVPGKRATSAALVTRARAMAKLAKPAHDEFVREDFPPDFLTRMLNTAHELKGLEHERETTLRRQKATTAALATGVPAARADVSILDGLLLPRMRKERPLLHAWTFAKKLRGRRGRPMDRRWKWSRGKTPIGI